MDFSETFKITRLNSSAGNAVDCDVVDMSNFQHGAFLISYSGSGGTGDLVLSLYEAMGVGASSNAAVTVACPVYADTDAGTSSDTLVRQADAYAITIDVSESGDQVWVMEIDPSILSDGYPCVYLADSGGAAGDVCEIFFLGIPRYKGSTLPSAIVS